VFLRRLLGAGGYLGANKVAEELGVKKWGGPTAEMQRDVETYLQ
jgi:hypothetical protein